MLCILVLQFEPAELETNVVQLVVVVLIVVLFQKEVVLAITVSIVCYIVEATIRQRRLLFAGALARQDDKRLPKRLLFAERLEGGQDPGPGQPAQHWQKSLRDDFKAFGALHGSTPSDRRTFGVDRLVWTEAARKGEGAPWYTGVLLGAERFMASWHKSEEEASKLREVNRAA